MHDEALSVLAVKPSWNYGPRAFQHNKVAKETIDMDVSLQTVVSSLRINEKATNKQTNLQANRLTNN